MLAARAARASVPPPPPPVPARAPSPGPEPAPVEEPAAAAAGAAAGASAAAGGFLPSPRAAAIAVLGMLGLGVLLGSATSQLARSAGIAPIIVLSSPAPEEEVAEEAEYEAPAEESAPAETVAAPLVPEEPLPEYEPAAEPGPTPELPPDVFEEEEEAEAQPEIDHVFVIVLGDNGFEEAFGKESTAPYLAKTLPEEGELLTNYYAVASGGLANQIALISGQGPTPETALDCPTYGDLLPGTISVEGQVEGDGCVYPAKAETLVSQLVAAKKTWKAYVEGMGQGVAAGESGSCRHPQLGSPDPGRAPLSGDAYETWRNPFVYFHAIADSSECAKNDVDLEQLSADLKAAKKTPTLAYIVPSACHAGGDLACEEARPTPEPSPSPETQSYTEPVPPAEEPVPPAEEPAPGEEPPLFGEEPLSGEEPPPAEAQPSGAVAAEEFLEQVVPEITGSPAYEEGHSLIAITSAQAPQSGEHADSSSCCATPEYPNLPPPAEAEIVPGKVKPSGGGGRVGLLLISPFVEPGSVDESGYYNHFTLLATIEELLGLGSLGYASEQLAFDSTVFNAGGEGESTAAGRPLGRTLSRAISAVRSAVPVPGRRR